MFVGVSYLVSASLARYIGTPIIQNLVEEKQAIGVVVLMNCGRILSCGSRYFTTLSSSSSLPWISPLQFIEDTARKPDPPLDTSITVDKTRRKCKYVDHQYAIELIKRERDPPGALEVFNMVSKQKGFNHNNATYATILNKLAQFKKFDAVDAVLRQMSYETCKFHEGIFLNLMKHFSKSGMHERVLDMFYAIHPTVREKPSPKAFSTCLNLLIESNRIDLSQKLLLHCGKILCLNHNTCIFNILVKHHCKRRDVDSAFEVFKEMKTSKYSYPNLITYSTLMDCLCRTGRLQEAVDLFEEMVSRDQIVPDALTYNLLINGFCQDGKVDRARKVIEFMKSNGCLPNIFNYSTLLNGLCKEKKLEEAKEVIDEVKSFGMKLDTIAYTTLINSFCRDGKTNEAIKLLKEMKDSGCKADIVTFNVLLGGFCREGRLDDALHFLDNLLCEGVRLNKGSYRIVLNTLCQKGKMDKAVELLYLMLSRGFVPHYATSNELLSSLCESQMAEDATNALYSLVEMGFLPRPDTWTVLIEMICRERKLLSTYELLDDLITA